MSNLPAHRLTDEQTAKAWNYAYRFFEYPRPFPWRLMNFWDDLEAWSLEKVLSDEGMSHFGDTFRFPRWRTVYLEIIIYHVVAMAMLFV
ncbi:MAG: hypothetical protein U0X92_17375 [Anaerolineales bacterium]